MTRYQAGQRAEWRARDMLKARGYHTVIRAAGSKGPFDLIGLTGCGIALVQVKRGRGISKSERSELLALKKMLPPLPLCSLQIWHFAPRKKLPDVEVL